MYRKRNISLLMVALFIIQMFLGGLGSSSVLATDEEPIEKGILRVKVYDFYKGEPLSGAGVTVSEAVYNEEYNLISGDGSLEFELPKQYVNGEYTLYNVKVEKEGYLTEQLNGLNFSEKSELYEHIELRKEIMINPN